MVQGAELSVRRQSLARSEHWLQVGQPCHEVAFIVRGTFRKYRIGVNGQEFTTDLVCAGGLLAPYVDLLQGRSCSLNLQALEKSELALIEFAQVRRLMQERPEWAVVRAQLAEALYMEKEWRESFLMTLGAAERLDYFLTHFESHLNSVPKQVVASYLGLHASTLSRLLRRRELVGRTQ